MRPSVPNCSHSEERRTVGAAHAGAEGHNLGYRPELSVHPCGLARKTEIRGSLLSSDVNKGYAQNLQYWRYGDITTAIPKALLRARAFRHPLSALRNARSQSHRLL